MSLINWAARSVSTTVLVVVVLAALAVSAGVYLKLTLVGAIGLFFVVWWTILFAILPIRIQSQSDAGEIAAGTDPGAPAAPALRERAIWTTLVASVLFVAVAGFLPLSGL